MVKELATLPADIHNLLDGASLEDSIGRFTDDIGKMMLKRFKSHDRKSALWMSNVGKPLRQLWYELRGPELGIKAETLSGQTKFKFLYGDLVESLVMYLTEASGHVVERLQERVEVDGVSGKIDAVIDGILVDVKSASSRTFDKFKSGKIFEDDPFGYVGQLSGYAKVLNLPAAWVVIDKVSGDIVVVHLPKEKIREYDIRKRIATVRSAINLDVEPERCYKPKPISKTDKSGNLVLDVGCGYCGWKEHCWRDSNNGTGLKTYFYSTGPKFFVHVEKEPRVNQKQDWYEFEAKPAESN